MRLKKVRHKRIWGNFVGISLLISVRRLERSESLQGVVISEAKKFIFALFIQ